jgi:hypothetical protein
MSIHYLLPLVMMTNAYVHDTDKQEVQSVPLAELEPAWDVNVPGLGKRNRLAILNIPQEIPPTDVLIRKSIGDECRMMLNPPVSMVGIPAMEKVSREIAHWSTELGKDGTEKSLQQVREYLNSPPDILGNHLTDGRDIYVTPRAGWRMINLDFSEAINRFQAGIKVMGKIADAISDHLDGLTGFAEIAKEKAAFTIL